MTLVTTVYVPEGIVMASDSRQSITIENKTSDGQNLSKIDTINSDNAYKTYLLSKKNEENKIIFEVGIQFFGQDLLGGIPMASHIKRFTEEETTDKDDICTIPKKLVLFFKKLFPTANTGFHVAGYKKEDKISIPYIYYCHISKDIIERKNIKPDESLAYGATWSGQSDVLAGVLQPLGLENQKDQIIQKPIIIWDAMPLQDAIDFSIFAINTTINAIRFQARPKNVGGPIDVLVFTPDGAKWIQKKELKSNLNAL